MSAFRPRSTPQVPAQVHLELFELHALVPAAVERLFHALDGDEPLAAVLWPTRWAGWAAPGRYVQRRMPVGEPDCSERTISDFFKDSPVSWGERR